MVAFHYKILLAHIIFPKDRNKDVAACRTAFLILINSLKMNALSVVDVWDGFIQAGMAVLGMVARHRWWASFHCLTEAMGNEFNYSNVHIGEKCCRHWKSDERQTDSEGLRAYVWQKSTDSQWQSKSVVLSCVEELVSLLVDWWSFLHKNTQKSY